MKYPLCLYFADGHTIVVEGEEAESRAKSEGAEYTPAAFGIETCPGVEPDPEIAARRAAPVIVDAGDVAMPSEGTPLEDMTRDQLIEIAANRTIAIDKRWSTDRIREALA